jgi:hypothetical protein
LIARSVDIDVHAPGLIHPPGRIMIFTNLRKMFSRPSKTLSTPEKREYKEAADEFTSEGAPPLPAKPDKAPASAPKARTRSLRT